MFIFCFIVFKPFLHRIKQTNETINTISIKRRNTSATAAKGWRYATTCLVKNSTSSQCKFHYAAAVRVLLPVCPFVCLSCIHVVLGRKLKGTKHHNWCKCNRCVNFHFKRSGPGVAQLYADGRTICRHWADVFF